MTYRIQSVAIRGENWVQRKREKSERVRGLNTLPPSPVRSRGENSELHEAQTPGNQENLLRGTKGKARNFSAFLSIFQGLKEWELGYGKGVVGEPNFGLK